MGFPLADQLSLLPQPGRLSIAAKLWIFVHKAIPVPFFLYAQMLFRVSVRPKSGNYLPKMKKLVNFEVDQL